MAKSLTHEEVLVLRANPNVASVIGEKVEFTPEFKRSAYQQLTNGKSMSSILTSCGIDPETLGHCRVHSLTHRIRESAKRDTGFDDLRKYNHGPAKRSKEQTLEAKVNELEHDLAYTRQEVEF